MKVSKQVLFPSSLTSTPDSVFSRQIFDSFRIDGASLKLTECRGEIPIRELLNSAAILSADRNFEGVGEDLN